MALAREVGGGGGTLVNMTYIFYQRDFQGMPGLLKVNTFQRLMKRCV